MGQNLNLLAIGLVFLAGCGGSSKPTVWSAATAAGCGSASGRPTAHCVALYQEACEATPKTARQERIRADSCEIVKAAAQLTTEAEHTPEENQHRQEAEATNQKGANEYAEEEKRIQDSPQEKEVEKAKERVEYEEGK